MAFPADDVSDGAARYRVVKNLQEQYALWPDFLAVPAGWQDTGVEGSHAQCVAHVDAIWTDMRPKSLRDTQDMAS